MMQIAFAITAAMFAAIYLVAIMVFGGEWARDAAIAAAFFGCAAQFTAQDAKAYKVSIHAAYLSFAIGALAYVWLVLGW